MWSWIVNIFINFLDFLYGIVGSYGIAIIILTIIVRVLLFPLTAAQTRSMKGMKDLQPKMEKIKEKYEDDKQKQQEKMLELYKENNVNPLGSCLPMILMMAIIIPLFHAIRNMGIEEGFLWIESLKEPDMILVALNGVAVFAQSYLTQMSTGKSKGSGMLMFIMPIFIVVIGLNLPAGVLIYFLVSTAIHALQHYFISKE